MRTPLYVGTPLFPLRIYVMPLKKLCTFYDGIPWYFDYHCSEEGFFLR